MTHERRAELLLLARTYKEPKGLAIVCELYSILNELKGAGAVVGGPDMNQEEMEFLLEALCAAGHEPSFEEVQAAMDAFLDAQGSLSL